MIHTFKNNDFIKYRSNWEALVSKSTHHSSTGFWLIKRIQIFTKLSNDGFILVWIFAENILDDNNGLLDNVIYFCLDQINQCLNTTLGRVLDFDGTTTNSAYSL